MRIGELVSITVLNIDIEKLVEKTRRVRALSQKALELVFKDVYPIIQEKKELVEYLTKDLLRERKFFEKIKADYNKITGYDVDCIKIAIGEYLRDTKDK